MCASKNNNPMVINKNMGKLIQKMTIFSPSVFPVYVSSRELLLVTSYQYLKLFFNNSKTLIETSIPELHHSRTKPLLHNSKFSPKLLLHPPSSTHRSVNRSKRVWNRQPILLHFLPFTSFSNSLSHEFHHLQINFVVGFNPFFRSSF